MAKNKKDFYSKEEIERRAEEHKCNGICYTDTAMCPRAEICPETGTKEFIGTICAIICYILFFNPVAWVIWLLILDYIVSK